MLIKKSNKTFMKSIRIGQVIEIHDINDTFDIKIWDKYVAIITKLAS